MLFHYLFNVLFKNQRKYFKVQADWTIRTNMAKIHKWSKKLISLFINWILLCNSNPWVNCIHCKDEIFFTSPVKTGDVNQLSGLSVVCKVISVPLNLCLVKQLMVRWFNRMGKGKSERNFSMNIRRSSNIGWSGSCVQLQ